MDRTYVKTCADCGSKTIVIDSREQETGAIMRRRRCPNCGYEFRTIEIEECMSDVADTFNEIDTLRTQNKKMISTIERIRNAINVDL